MRGYETTTDFSENGHDHGEREGQTYLRVAEIVLSKALSPLNAREIVERGIEQGLFGDHVMSRTPEKSMQARLSIDILSQGQNSRFARTSKGRFTLRSRLSPERLSDGAPGEDRVEYLAKRRNLPKVLRTPKEEVLCVSEEGFRDVLTFQGIDTDSTEILRRLLQEKHLHYVGRSEAETRDDAKQFITYVFVQCGQRLLFFSRSYLSRAAEFLRGSKCVGFGGHVSAADMDILSHGDRGLSSCARRELSEELRLPERTKRTPSDLGSDRATLQLFQGASLERLAVLNDDSSEVGRRHVAVVYRAWLPDWEQARRLQKGDSSIKGVSWIDLSKDTIDIAEYEYWSQLCLRKFYPSTVIAKAKFEVLNSARLLSDRIIAVSGRIGSGKSETASYLSERLDIPLVKTGAILAKLMASPSLEEIGRAEFQARALSFIRDESGPEKLAAAILDNVNALSNSRCLVDGIRNLSTYEILKAKTLGSLALLFVQTPPDLAFDMYRAREATGTLTFSYRDFLKVYDAPVEAEITSLGRNASAYIYNSFGLEAFRRTLDHVVETMGGTPQ